MKKALTIAGFDPSGSAGLQIDLKVFHLLDVYGFSAVAALTAQNSTGVKMVQAVDGKLLYKQLSVLLSDLRPEAIKIGMLLSRENVDVVARIVNRFRLNNIVLDPLIFSSSGMRLAEDGVPEIIREKIFPLCTAITPNIKEASFFSGIEITSEKDMKNAAMILKDSGPENIVITGGHLEGSASDILYDGEFSYFRSRKIKGEFHGTGCVFSSAIAAFLALGYDMTAAVQETKRFMNSVFKKTFSPGKGMKLFAF